METKETAPEQEPVTKSLEQQAEEKAAELTELYKKDGVFKVHAYVFKDDDGRVDGVAFVKEPTRMAKMAVMDKALVGGFSAAEEIVPSVLIKEFSDPRTYSASQEFDDIYIGLVMFVYQLIKFKPNTLKKK